MDSPIVVRFPCDTPVTASTHTGTRRSGSRVLHRRATFDALENRLVLSTVQFTAATETVNQTAGSFSFGVSLSSPPAGTVTVSNFAAINTPTGMAVDAHGNLYVADYQDNLVKEVTPAGVISTFATGLPGPEALAFGPNGDLYVANNFDGVEEVSPSGKVTEIANGSAFDDPRGIAIDKNGIIYVANSGNGTVVEVAPNTGLTGTFATGFNYPVGLAFGPNGNLYVANDLAGTVNEVTPGGKVSTFVSGFSEFAGPGGLAFDAAGNLYIGSDGGGEGGGAVTKATPTGAQSDFVAGNNSISFPLFLTIDAAGNLFVSGMTGPTNEVFKVTQTVTASFSLGGSAISGLAYTDVTASPLTFGIGITSLNITGTLLPDPSTPQTLSFSLDTTTGGADLGDPLVNTMTINEPVFVQFGSASETVSESDGTFSLPVTVSATPTEAASVPFSLGGSAVSGVTFSGITANPLTFGVGQTTVDITGTLLSDPGPSQTLTLTLDTSATGAVVGPQSSNTLTITEPASVQFDTGSETVNESAGTFSISVTVSGTPTVSTFASGFDQPYSLAVDSAGNLYVPNGLDDTVSKVTPAGVVSTFASGFSGPLGLAFDAAGNLYVVNGGDGTVSKVSPTGVVTLSFASGFNFPGGIAVDPAGNLYVDNTDAGTVSKVSPTGVVTPFAFGLIAPFGLAFHAGNLFVANTGGNTVSEVTPAGVVSTFAAGLDFPTGLAFDSTGNLYVGLGNNTVSQVTPAGVVSTLATGFDEPSGVAFASGNLYVANTDNNTVSEVTQLIAVPFTLGGSATSGVDFSGVTASPLLFGIGQTTLDITGKLLHDPGPGRALTFTLGTPIGNAALGNPSANTLTINESATGTPTPTPSPTSQPMIIGEQPLFRRKTNKKGKPAGKPILQGFTLEFSRPMGTSAGDSVDYSLERIVAKATKKKPAKLRNVGFAVAYSPAGDTVTVNVAGNQTFPSGGLLDVSDTVTSADGASLAGTDAFAIGKGGKTIEPE